MVWQIDFIFISLVKYARVFARLSHTVVSVREVLKSDF